MYKYFISICFLFVFLDGFSQEQKTAEKETEKDTVIYKSAYGLRVGIDLNKPIQSMIDDSYEGFEIVGDYRISQRFFIAAEVGYEKETTVEDYTNSTSKGNYARVGFNFNSYKNWLDMTNEIILGYRYGFSLFDQTLNSYTPNVTNAENGIYFPSNTITTPQTATGLTAHWSEFVIGFKVEFLKNFYLGVSGSYKIMMAVENPENFESLYAPGFNTIHDSDTGFGFNYTLSYTIPFVNK